MNCALILLLRLDFLWMWAIVGVAGGLLLFVRGFKILQRKRLILNTPISKIRSASLGLVEVSGLATGPHLIEAPLTGKACYFYRTIAWELRKASRNQQWRKVADESLHVPFYIDDNTGLLLVNPQGAETDLHRDFRGEYSNSFFSPEQMPGRVREFLQRYGITGEHRVRVEEYAIKSQNALFILGTLAENPGLEVGPEPLPTQAAASGWINIKLTSEALDSAAAKLMPNMGADRGCEQEVIHLSGRGRPLHSAEMTQQGKIAAALLRAGSGNPRAWAAAGFDHDSPAVAIEGQPEPALQSARRGAGAGPAANNFDLHPKVVLLKGENTPAFFISWRSQRRVASSLGARAIACIWGGPALTLLSVYVLLARLEWL